VIVGPYRGWLGEILTVHADSQRVTVALSVYGRPTATVLPSGQMEPAPSS
jgi:transcription antitermination factor NusG